MKAREIYKMFLDSLPEGGRETTVFENELADRCTKEMDRDNHRRILLEDIVYPFLVMGVILITVYVVTL